MAQQGAARVDAIIAAIAVVANGSWRSEECYREAKVIDIQVGKGSASHRGVEHRREFAIEIAVVAAASLCIVAIHHPYTSLPQFPCLRQCLNQARVLLESFPS